jgi:hypothetical protein
MEAEGEEVCAVQLGQTAWLGGTRSPQMRPARCGFDASEERVTPRSPGPERRGWKEAKVGKEQAKKKETLFERSSLSRAFGLHDS